MAEKEDVIKKTYDLLLYIIPQLEKLPRTQKFLLADRIETRILEILEMFIEAYYTQRSEKLPILRKVNLELEKLRYLIRLCHDFKYFNNERYGLVSEKINEIGKITGGWLKTLG